MAGCCFYKEVKNDEMAKPLAGKERGMPQWLAASFMEKVKILDKGWRY